jgi:hypothetical protein
MKTSSKSGPVAWEPLTPRGVAAFSGASARRLLIVQLIVAALASGVMVWFLNRAWVPVIHAAIDRLPPTGQLRNQQLFWAGDTSVQLARNHFLGLAVDLNHSGLLVREAHLQLEFGRRNFRVISAFGYDVIEYPPGWNVGFNRTTLNPWWGAWEPALLAAVAVLMFTGLLVVWFALETVYCLPVFVVSFFVGRKMSLPQCWRLSGAALMPGAIFLTTGLVCYTLDLINLVHLTCIFVLHVLIGWIYLYISPVFLPRKGLGGARKRKPFQARVETDVNAAGKSTADQA